ncbi:MAG: class I SAM-dependent methyltransferase [Armatimonadetes bacterium]|nr:class I SAM-dependent methyltransferase [Armatimonadota bacterium]MDE2206527.1 class I SAM-dependent methyltransferase [Armatimonadota bacterium]
MSRQTAVDPSWSYDRVAEEYDQSRTVPQDVARRLWQIVKAAGSLSDGSVALDAAAGTGRFTLAAATAGLSAVAVDRSAGMLSVLRRKANQSAVTVQCALGDVTALPLRSETIDVVLMVHILHLLPDPDAALAEVQRVLVRGGMLFAAREVREEISLRDQYVTLAAGLGATAESGSPMDAVLAHLTENGANVERVDDGILCWRRRLSWEQALEQLRSRSWHYQWTISSAAHDAVMAQLELWMRANEIIPEQEWSGAAALHLWRVGWPPAI